MRKVREDKYLKIRALAYAIDECLQQIDDSDSIYYENASMLSELMLQEFFEIDNEEG